MKSRIQYSCKKKITLFSWEAGGLLSAGSRTMAAMEASSQPFRIVLLVKYTYNRSQRSKVFVFHLKISLLHPRSEFPTRRYCWFISSINASI